MRLRLAFGFLAAQAFGCSCTAPGSLEPVEGETPTTQVTAGRSGEDRDPELTPDGKTLLYASNAYGEDYDLYARPVGGNAPVRLTRLDGHERFPRVNPADPRMLAFCSDAGGEWQISLLPDWRGNPEKAVTITEPGSHNLAPSWSPDGRRLVYCSTSDLASGDWILKIRDLTTGRTIVLEDLDGFLPRWSPKGDRIAFQRMSRRDGWLGGLWTLDFDGVAARNVTALLVHDDWAAINPTWSPDGRRLVFATAGKSVAGRASLDRADDLWVVDADGGPPARLTTHPAPDFLPAWSADGRIYFASGRGGSTRIWSLVPRLP
jgi:Tol biopolymer transport system component